MKLILRGSIDALRKQLGKLEGESPTSRVFSALCFNGVISFLFIFLFLSTTTYGQEDAEKENIPSPSAQKSRPANLWRDYMHGISDQTAQPIDLTALFSKTESTTGVRVVEAKVESSSRTFDAKAISLTAPASILSSQLLPLDTTALAKKKVRFFIWARGEKTGRENSPNSYGDSPQFSIRIYGAKNKQLSRTETIAIGTVGTFPWHCYLLEVFIPKEATGIRLELRNPEGGEAWFTGFSYERITKENDYSNSDRQDPTTGSTASNVYYDAMNRQFARGVPTRYPWNYFKGPNAGLLGQAYDVTTPDGLDRYFREKVKTDDDHMNHSFMYFASRYLRGRAAGVLPEGMNDAWFNAFTELVVNDQNKETGYWGSAQHPSSMGITFHFVEGLFSYYPVKRPDFPEKFNDMRHIGVLEIPHADRILRTTLAMQATVRDAAGVERKAGWPRSAYNFTTTPNGGKERASLVVVNNAFELLRRCERFVDPSLKKESYEAIKSAFHYVLEKCVLDNGLWLQSDMDAAPSTDNFMGRVINMSHYLERRIDPQIAEPVVRWEQSRTGPLSLRWLDPKPDDNSLRIYQAAPDADPASLNESNLVAIIHRTGHKIQEMDPLLAVRKMGQAKKERWGENWETDSYMGWKALKLTPEKIAMSNDLSPLPLPNALRTDTRYYASAVTWYGEESLPVSVPAPQ